MEQIFTRDCNIPHNFVADTLSRILLAFTVHMLLKHIFSFFLYENVLFFLSIHMALKLFIATFVEFLLPAVIFLLFAMSNSVGQI